MVSIMAVMAIVMFASTISADDHKDSTQINGSDYTAQYPIMRPDPETLHGWVELYNSAPQAYIAPEVKMMLRQSPRTSFSLLDRIDYDPVERDQGWCGNCWVWTDTGVLEVALSAQEGIKDRLSVQYFDSCYNEGLGENWACCGGWASEFTYWYRANGLAIPWSNTNAQWQDGNRTCGNLSSSVPCGNISTSLNYPITNCTTTRIETHGVGKETAIANIKNVLHQNKAIDFGFFLPNSEDWNNFFDFWSYDAENAIWNPDFSSGHTWVNGEGGGHAVLCVGYNDTDPDNSYWIMLNSWGTTEGRPNGLFYLDMNMSYDCYFIDDHLDIYSFYWETIDVTFEITPFFDTGSGTYPSISGTHNGTITPSHDVFADKMYTYPCAGTGGHSEYVRIWGSGIDVNTSWSGYVGNYHNISFSKSFSMNANHTYNYTIRTGSYPQIIHKQNYTTLDGSLITCTKFTDANGRVYYDGIPAIRLYF